MKTLEEFRDSEYQGAPLNSQAAFRLNKALLGFIKSHAMTKRISESTIIRYAVWSYCKENGFTL